MITPTLIGPLAGMKILDLTRVLAGPFATMLPGDPLYRTRLVALVLKGAALPPPAAFVAALRRGFPLAQRHWDETLPPAWNAFLRGVVERFVVTGRELLAVPNAGLATRLAAHARGQISATQDAGVVGYGPSAGLKFIHRVPWS